MKWSRASQAAETDKRSHRPQVVTSVIRSAISIESATDDTREGRAGVARFLGRAIFNSLLGLIFLVAIPYGTVEPWWEALFECLVFALAALWAIEGYMSGRGWFRRGHQIFLPLLALMIFAFVQSIQIWGINGVAGEETLWRTLSADPFETRRAAFKLLALMLAGILLLRYASSRRRLRALVYAVIGVGLMSAVFGLVRQMAQTEELGFGLPYLRLKQGFGQFINRNHFAFLMEMSFGLSLGLVIGGGVKRERVLIHLVPALLIWTALVLSNSRGGLFSMMAQVVVMMLLFSLRRGYHESPGESGEASTRLERMIRSFPFRAGMVALLIGVVFVGALWIGGESLTERLETAQSEIEAPVAGERGGARRGVVWAATWELIKAHPITGIGFGGYWIAITQFHRAQGDVTPRQAHNDYLELLASGGIIGLALGVWFVISVVRRTRRTLRSVNPFRRAACFGALVGLSGVAAHSLVDFGLHITINALVFMALIVISIASARDAPKGEL